MTSIFLLSKNKKEKLVHDCYVEVYKAATPSADFDELLRNADIDENGMKDIHYNNYEITMSKYNEVIAEVCAKYRVNKKDVYRVGSELSLGAMPNFIYDDDYKKTIAVEIDKEETIECDSHFNVLIWNHNSNKVESYDIMPYLVHEYYKVKKSRYDKTPKTDDEFIEFVKGRSSYMYWSRCEYELTILGRVFPEWYYKSKEKFAKLQSSNDKHLANYYDLDVNKVIDENRSEHADEFIDMYKEAIAVETKQLSEMDTIDVHYQVMMNIDNIANLLKNEVKRKTKKKRV